MENSLVKDSQGGPSEGDVLFTGKLKRSKLWDLLR